MMLPKLLFSTIILTFIQVSLIKGQHKQALSPAMEVHQHIGQTEIRIKYNAPSKRERVIWGDLVPYGQVWRTGANNATVFSTDQSILIGGKELPKGSYALFMIPDENVWTVIFNSVPNQWGAFSYDVQKDILRIEAIPRKTEHSQEQMSLTIEDAKLVLRWDDLELKVPLKESPIKK